MNLEYCEAVPKDAKKIIDYLNKVAGESNNLTFGLEDWETPVHWDRL